ncbi:hypothetical protein VP01_531g4 [Puccinia sorghi]|uniref:Uncharacterized protein n=1 Tax=Puccinia sorghi TaxID=27349 RepID=A0A0L6UK88_9BASI|nr:hypothetical protein VP01_531g4 [Puccinia sorghi]
MLKGQRQEKRQEHRSLWLDALPRRIRLPTPLILIRDWRELGCQCNASVAIEVVTVRRSLLLVTTEVISVSACDEPRFSEPTYDGVSNIENGQGAERAWSSVEGRATNGKGLIWRCVDGRSQGGCSQCRVSDRPCPYGIQTFQHGSSGSFTTAGNFTMQLEIVYLKGLSTFFIAFSGHIMLMSVLGREQWLGGPGMLMVASSTDSRSLPTFPSAPVCGWGGGARPPRRAGREQAITELSLASAKCMRKPLPASTRLNLIPRVCFHLHVADVRDGARKPAGATSGRKIGSHRPAGLPYIAHPHRAVELGKSPPGLQANFWAIVKGKRDYGVHTRPCVLTRQFMGPGAACYWPQGTLEELHSKENGELEPCHTRDNLVRNHLHAHPRIIESDNETEQGLVKRYMLIIKDSNNNSCYKEKK